MNAKRLYVALAALFTAAAVCACGSAADELPVMTIDDGAVLHTQKQSAYLADAYGNIADHAVGVEELSAPAPVYFTWADVRASAYTFELSSGPSFASPITVRTEKTFVDVYNLQTGTKYYWRVTAKVGEKTQKSAVSSFTTESVAPRNLYVEGVTNVRDLGGWKTSDGKTVKQGMMIRCGRLNKSGTAAPDIEITENGIRTMRDLLGVRTEVDLRMPDAHGTEKGGSETGGITSSPLGADINYVNIPMDWAKNSSAFNYLAEEEYYPAIKAFFALASDKKNYPMIFHCNIGTDRTGLFAFLVNGLLGVSEDDLYRDYLFSNFGKIGASRSIGNIGSYVDTIKSYGGSSLSEQIANCLADIGVPRAHLDGLISVMKPD